jgi:hypothetical protein
MEQALPARHQGSRVGIPLSPIFWLIKRNPIPTFAV